MAPISKDQAANLFIEAVQKARPDELVEFYNELFPMQPTTEESAKENLRALADRVLAHIRQGLEIEEVLDFWNVAFPERHRLWFDEEDGLFHLYEDREPVTQPE
jgi:hypothetical protein